MANANVRYRYEPTQADVVTFKAFKSEPEASKYQHVARWYKHIASFESEFATLPGDASKDYTAYGPENSELPINTKEEAPAAEDEDDIDLFDSEDEDPEVVAERERNLAAYRAKKASKPKPVAKSIVTLDVKPWGMSDGPLLYMFPIY